VDVTEPLAATDPADKPFRVFRGWESIGGALEVDSDTAFKYAARPFDPLPVYYDHARRPCCPCTALRDWELRQALPFFAYHELESRGRLPAQITEDPSRQAARRTKVAQRGRGGSSSRSVSGDAT
jgi:hypothetical protein